MLLIRIKWVPSHHGPSHSRVAANVVNKESWTANRGWSSTLVVVPGPNKLSLYSLIRYVDPRRASELDGILSVPFCSEQREII